VRELREGKMCFILTASVAGSPGSYRTFNDFPIAGCGILDQDHLAEESQQSIEEKL
jgi:hypothetical protein